jgi:hypothetical protein
MRASGVIAVTIDASHARRFALRAFVFELMRVPFVITSSRGSKEPSAPGRRDEGGYVAVVELHIASHAMDHSKYR